MIWFARALRLALIGACLLVLGGILPISLEHFQTGSACPMLGPLPACYVVSIAYAAMALAGLIWWCPLLPLFLLGAIPVITLALIGTASELAGVPTCPRSAEGLPLCYASLAVGVALLVTFLTITVLERKAQNS